MCGGKPCSCGAGGGPRAINEGIGKALSGGEIQELVPYPINILRYRDLYEVKRLEDIMPAVLLYETEKDFGHWVSLFLDEAGDANVFDPYGYSTPDAELFFIPREFREEGGAMIPVLTILLLDWAERHPDRKVITNEHRIQSKDASVSTCGRHAALRLKMSELTLPDYTAFLRALAKKMGKPIDWVVTFMTTPQTVDEKVEALTGGAMAKKRPSRTKKRSTKRAPNVRSRRVVKPRLVRRRKRPSP